MKQIFDDGKSVSIIDGHDFVIVKKQGNPYVDYSESHFVEDSSDFSMDGIEKRNSLTDGKYYKFDKSINDLKKYIKQFDLDVELAEKKEVIKPLVDNDDDLDDFEKMLKDDIDNK